MLNRRRTSLRGFTLVELIAVVLVLAVLAVVAVAAFRQVKDKSAERVLATTAAAAARSLAAQSAQNQQTPAQIISAPGFTGRSLDLTDRAVTPGATSGQVAVFDGPTPLDSLQVACLRYTSGAIGEVAAVSDVRAVSANANAGNYATGGEVTATTSGVYSGGSVTTSTTTTAPHSGARTWQMVIAPTVMHFGNVLTPTGSLPVVEGRRYTFSSWMRSDPAGGVVGVYPQIHWYRPDGTTITWHPLINWETFAVPTTWTRVEVSANAPAGAVSTIGRFQANNSAATMQMTSTATVWIDDVQFQAGPTATPYVDPAVPC